MSNFECEICCYKTCRKWDFNKHMETKKHKREVEERENTPKTTNNDFLEKNEKKSLKVVKSRKKSLNSPPVHLQYPPATTFRPPITTFCPPVHLQYPPISSGKMRKKV